MKRLFRYWWHMTPAEIFDALKLRTLKYFRRARWDNVLCAMGFCGAAALLMRYRDSLGNNEAMAATVAPAVRAEPIQSNFQWWRVANNPHLYRVKPGPQGMK